MMSVLKGLFGVEPYRWDSLVMKHNIPKNYERRVGRGKSIYRRWGQNGSGIHICLSNAFLQTQANQHG